MYVPRVYLEALLAGLGEDLWCGWEEDAPQPVQVLTRQLNRGVRHAHRQQPPGRVVLKKVIRTCQRIFYPGVQRPMPASNWKN